MEKKRGQPSALARMMMEYLACPCEVFAPMEDDDPIMDAYVQAQKQGKQDGFIPVIVKVDGMLWEQFCLNLDDGDGLEPQPELVHAYREELLAWTVPPDGHELLEGMLEARRQEFAQDGLDMDAEFMGEMAGGEANDRFSAYWNYETGWTDEVLLAKIPVKEAWEVFAWLPMGGWNDCPEPLDMMAAARHWYRQYGAAPACISHGELEFLAGAPVEKPEAAKALAMEQYAFCPDRVEQCEEDGSIGKLADSLMKSKVWYFWWD